MNPKLITKVFSLIVGLLAVALFLYAVSRRDREQRSDLLSATVLLVGILMIPYACYALLSYCRAMMGGLRIILDNLFDF